MRPLLAVAAAITMLAMTQSPTAAQAQGAFDHEFEAIEGGKMPLSQWRGKALLIVNTASFCGYTPQYEGLQTLWERYEAAGLVVIGVPSNDFGAQEPNSESEILSARVPTTSPFPSPARSA
jgi:glutathione peroxidase